MKSSKGTKRPGPFKKLLKQLSKVNRLFSKCIVIYCIAYMTHVIERVLDITERSSVDCSSIITAAAAVFGGELLLLAFKDGILATTTAVVDKVKAAIRDC